MAAGIITELYTQVALGVAPLERHTVVPLPACALAWPLAPRPPQGLRTLLPAGASASTSLRIVDGYIKVGAHMHTKAAPGP